MQALLQALLCTKCTYDCLVGAAANASISKGEGQLLLFETKTVAVLHYVNVLSDWASHLIGVQA